ncbi:uncharacterized protein METZ01_LOCUS294084, partial [marine metagenome]
MTLTFAYAGTNKPIVGVRITMTESDGTVTILTTDVNGQVTLPTTSNTYTLAASLAETGTDPVDLLDAIWILQHSGELRTLTADQLKAADVNGDGEVDLLDAIQILQHSGELRTLTPNLVFLDANTGNDLSETTYKPGDTPSITVIRTGDVDQSFDPWEGGILLNTYSFNENASGVSVGDITVIGLDAGSGFTYSLSGEDARFFEITSEGVLKLKDGFEADYERDADYEITITAENDAGESLSTAIELSVDDVAEAIEKANLHAWGKNYYRLANDTIWLQDNENVWYETADQFYQIIKVPEKNSIDVI